MIQVSLQHVRKSYGDKDILTDVTFSLESGERAALVGINGSGKSTLLHLLAGSETPDGGQIRFFSRPSSGILEQSPGETPELLCRENGEREGEFRQKLGNLGIAGTTECPAESLSGGEQMKLALSGLLAQNPELLLLDEPTNNLDYEGISALIDTVGSYPGTLLIVSHDRYFLDCTVSRILELENGKITEYPGSYSDYREEKSRLYAEQVHRWEEGQKQQQQIDQSIRQLKDWSAKGHRDSTKKDKSGNSMGVKEFHRAKAKHTDKQVKNQIRRLEQLKEESEERPSAEKKVYFQVQSQGKRGKRVIEAEGISKSFGDRLLFSDSDFILMRGEHAAVFGPNGCGKTTLVRMIQGIEQPDRGRLWVSPAGPPFVLSQNVRDLPPDRTPLQYFTGLWGNLDGEQRIQLANMGLSASHLSRKISSLSYGERMKVKLAELVLSQCDFIILDEPTNHLDLHAREMLEDTLSQYEGTLLVVSHDVYFLNKLCDKVLLFDGGRIRKLETRFEDYWAASHIR